MKKIITEGAKVELAHGSGGKSMADLIDELFVTHFDNPWLKQKNDQANLERPEGRIVMTTDSYVITPLFFPGGNIGSLSVHGTINDVAMAGARPLYLSSGYILEEGFPLVELEKIVMSMAQAAREAGVSIVTGDTKVVQRGKGDGVFINTTGVGVIPAGINISVDQVRPGDKIIINGYIGDHGVAVMSLRNNMGFSTQIESDSAALHTLVRDMISVAPHIHCLRDPTRGGVAATLNEIASQAKVDIVINEKYLPIREEVQSACELLGLDPLYVANEGKLLAFVPASEADQCLAKMREHPLGKNAAIIGEVQKGTQYFVEMATEFGGARLVHWLSGEQLPRIC